VHESFHFTINADGSLTAFLDRLRVECKCCSAIALAGFRGIPVGWMDPFARLKRL